MAFTYEISEGMSTWVGNTADYDDPVTALDAAIDEMAEIYINDGQKNKLKLVVVDDDDVEVLSGLFWVGEGSVDYEITTSLRSKRLSDVLGKRRY